MLASTKYFQPPFDFEELVAELEFTFQKREALSPVKTGDYTSDLRLKKENFNRQLALKNSEAHGSVLLRNYAGKPLVISFYSSRWQGYGINQLRQLNGLQNEIRALGGNLLVITPDDPDEALREITWNYNLHLDFYYDEDHRIAKKFKVYAEHDPTWSRYAGIDENAPLSATYVLDANNQIIFDDVNVTLEQRIDAERLFEAVQRRSFEELKSKSA